MRVVKLDPEEGEVVRVQIPDGRIATVTPLTYGRARLHVSQPNSEYYDDSW